MARDGNFKAAETVAFDSSATTVYDLSVAGDSYELFANDQRILGGSLRTYSFSPTTSDPVLPYNPYETSNSFFLGDLNSEGRSIFSLGAISVYS